MNENERKTLFGKYIEMPEEELTEMLAVDESEYREGVFPLLIEAAKSRGLGTNIDEIIKKAISAKKEFEQKVAVQTLSSRQRRLFTIFPCIAYFYYIFAPAEWQQRKKEAFRCQLIGTRNYLIVGLIFIIVIKIRSNTPVSSDEILLILVLSLMLFGIYTYLFFHKKKHQKTQSITNRSSGTRE